MISRREALAASIAVTSLSGCTRNISGLTDEQAAVAIERTEIQQEEEKCVSDPSDEASISFDEESNLITVTGEFATEDSSIELLISAQNSVGYKDRPKDEVLIDIDPIASEEEGDSCSAIIVYTAQIEVNRQPSAIEVYHTNRERRGDAIARSEID